MLKKLIELPALIFGIVLAFNACKKDGSAGSENSGHVLAKPKFNSNVTYGTITDQDGNVYKTVIIGTQTWMAENLKVTHYNDGTPIPNVTGNEEWKSLSTGAYCNYNNTANKDTIDTYGRLYNWYAVNTGKLAPKGWHVATDIDWANLEHFLGEDQAVGKLKEEGTDHWMTPNMAATNESGFTALPAGERYYYGEFYDIGEHSYWWSSTLDYGKYALEWGADYRITNLGRCGYEVMDGFSVRCIKDN